MIDIFIKDDAEIETKVFVGKSKSNPELLYCDVAEDKLKEVAGDDLAEGHEEHKVWFKVPSYGDANHILDAAISIKGDDLQISPAELRGARLRKLIRRWTFGGKEVKVSGGDVDKLHPMVALMISYAMDAELRERGLL